MVGTRLEKNIESKFFICWTNLLLGGLRKGDGITVEYGKTADKAANELVRKFLKTECDSILFLDSDAYFDVTWLERFRTLKEGWDYDILQAFHTGNNYFSFC